MLFRSDLGDGQEQTDFGVLVKSFKASESDEMVNELKTVLMSEINQIKDRCKLARELEKIRE